MSEALAAEGLSKAFGGVQAVDAVTFRLERGEMVALIGPNGAGKSTCFNLLGGQLRPDAGQVRLHGQNVTGLKARRLARLGLGRTFQIAATFASMTLMENMQAAHLAGAGRMASFWPRAGKLYRDEAEALLARVGMAERAGWPCGLLSYGDLKRVELALALAQQPSLLLMDEPTAGMAATERRGLMALIDRIAQRDGLTVLFTEHDMDIVFGHARRILVLDRGRLIAEGSPEAVRADPEVRRVYLGGLVEGA